jgi:hypothetical protein
VFQIQEFSYTLIARKQKFGISRSINWGFFDWREAMASKKFGFES